MSKRIYLNYPDRTACGHYRAVLPHRHCGAILAEEGIDLDLRSDLNLNEDYDVLIFHRVINPQYIPTLLKLKERGKKLVWALDDDLFNIPNWSPVRNSFTEPFRDSLKLTLDWSDEIIVSTETLKQHLGYQDKTTVMPNLVDLNDWRQPRFNEVDSVTRILWAGSDTHKADLEEVVPALLRIADEYGDKVQFIFAGMVPEPLAGLPQTTFLPMVPLETYPDLMQLVKPHIALLPLADHRFNQSKSAIKWFEMTMAGAVCVASDYGPYGETMNPWFSRMVVDGDWYSRIRDVIPVQDTLFSKGNHSERFNLWKRSLREVAEMHSWDSWSKNLWLDWFRQVAVWTSILSKPCYTL